LITPFGCALPSVGAARTLPLRLRRAADAFDPRLDRFVAISYLRCCIADVTPSGPRHCRLFRGDTEVR
jgi:hypothetical protein